MFDILHYTFLRLDDAHRFGPSHLKPILKQMAIEIETEKSKGSTKVSIPIHPDFARSLAAARDAGILGTGEVFTGKLIKGEVLPMAKKAWAAKFKKYARLAGINEPKMNCHRVRKARAEDVAYAGATIPHMMAMFGWKDEKMPSIYIAKADRERLGFDGMNAYDQMQNIANLPLPEDENRIVTFESNRRGDRARDRAARNCSLTT